MNRTGIVSFVGVGPGDPNLMTVRGTELVRRADVLVYDSMLNREILEFAQQGVEQIVAGAPETSDPSKIAQIMLTRARDGKRVARLVCGDPYFTMEVTAEIDHVARSGVRFEVVPGVPFALVLPSRLGIPLFHPQHRTGFSIVALANCDEMPSMELASVCKGAGTKVILGRLKEVGRLVDDLLSQGLDPDTPAALVRSDRKGKPQAITGSVRELGALATQAGFETADVIVVGDVVLLRSHLNWVDKLPLAGQRIAVTRAKDQAGELTRLFLERGAEVLEVPCIKIEPPTKPEPLAEALAGLGCYDWIIFTSVNGVTAFFDHFFRTFEDLRDLGGARIAAVGPATAARLQALHLKVDLVPKSHTASAIANELAEMGSLENLRILLPRAEVATPDLPALLEDKGAIVDDIACYRTVAETEDITGAAAQLRESGADWITFTSGSTVEQCHSRFNLPELKQRFPDLRFASIGPETTRALAALSLKPDLEAHPHTVEALVAGVERVVRQARRKAGE